MDRDDYTSGAKSLHWLIALLIFVLFPLGWVMGDFSGAQKAQAYNLHKSLGLIVLTLMALRIYGAVSIRRLHCLPRCRRWRARAPCSDISLCMRCFSRCP